MVPSRFLQTLTGLVCSLAAVPMAPAAMPFLPQGENTLVGNYLRSPGENEIEALREFARNHDFIVLHEWSENKIPILRAENPDIVILLYKGRGFSTNNVETVASYSQVAHNTSWFMYNSSGQVVSWDWDGNGTTDGWSPRPENTAYQQYFINSVLGDLRRGGWDGLLIDDLWTTLTPYGISPPVHYANADALCTAMAGFLRNVKSALNAEGFVLAGNIGWWQQTMASGERVGRLYLREMNMGMQEKFQINYATFWNPGRAWYDEMRALRADIDATNGSAFLYARADELDQRSLMHVLTSQLCITNNDGRVVYQMLNTRDSTRVTPVFPESAAAEALGSPIAPVQWEPVLQLGVRFFENGFVVVNPNSSLRVLEGFNGQTTVYGEVIDSNKSYDLPARSGMIFFSPAPFAYANMIGLH